MPWRREQPRLASLLCPTLPNQGGLTKGAVRAWSGPVVVMVKTAMVMVTTVVVVN